jgi:hypothetical protein
LVGNLNTAVKLRVVATTTDYQSDFSGILAA